eukprot:CAMPEP_0172466450 /NCGR_PEP_ID=MMETSP1065-20121228/56173_1 /TAXON_ID=265537 /ORGANISM="Amphiprora paludosa, Strain CCMP125" /LENGTH=236 /DNA_ID=CAMNT_0013223253 /DNA_START=76 /DNA_END=783 /DNA_ORIENTATION=-
MSSSSSRRSLLLLLFVVTLLLFANPVQAQNQRDPQEKVEHQHGDWLLTPKAGHAATVYENVCWEDGLCGLEMSNGLLTRRWTLDQPGFGTVDLLMKDTQRTRRQRDISLLRALEPEAWMTIQKTIPQRRTATTTTTTTHHTRSGNPMPKDDDTETTFSIPCRVGDLVHDNGGVRAYLNRTNLAETLSRLPMDAANFCTYRYVSHKIIPNIAVDFDWTLGTRHGLDETAGIAWPPKG